MWVLWDHTTYAVFISLAVVSYPWDHMKLYVHIWPSTVEGDLGKPKEWMTTRKKEKTHRKKKLHKRHPALGLFFTKPINFNIAMTVYFPHVTIISSTHNFTSLHYCKNKIFKCTSRIKPCTHNRFFFQRQSVVSFKHLINFVVHIFSRQLACTVPIVCRARRWPQRANTICEH